MRYLLGFLPALACAGMMFVCFRMMFGGRKTEQPERPATAKEVAQLRKEVARLKAARSAEPAEQVGSGKD